MRHKHTCNIHAGYIQHVYCMWLFYCHACGALIVVVFVQNVLLLAMPDLPSHHSLSSEKGRNQVKQRNQCEKRAESNRSMRFVLWVSCKIKNASELYNLVPKNIRHTFCKTGSTVIYTIPNVSCLEIEKCLTFWF